MKTISIEYVQVSDLIAFQNNSRAHSDAQIAQVAASMSRFGNITPIAIDGENVIVAGHARLSAAKKLGLQSVPTVRVDHLSEEEVRLYRIADNKLAENATWDERALRLELEYLSEIDIDISLSGFELPEIDVLLADNTADEKHQTEAMLAPPGNPVVQKGDLFLLGSHRVICGDCRNSETMSRLMEGARAGVVVTDPPFNVRVNGHVLTGKCKHAEFAMASGEMSADEFTAFLVDSFTQFREYSVDGSLHYIFMDWRHVREILQAGDQVYDDLLNICVWAKTNAGMGSLYPVTPANPVYERAGALLNIDMPTYFRATQENYFDRINKGQLLKVAEQAVSPEWAASRQTSKKGDLSASMGSKFERDPADNRNTAEQQARIDAWVPDVMAFPKG